MNDEKDATPEVVENETTKTDEVAPADEAGETVPAEEAEVAEEENSDAETASNEGGAEESVSEVEDDDDGVQVVHSSDYDSQRAFAEFPLSAVMLQGIEAHGYKTATAVQAATLDAALAGRDMVVRSKTGTGKTAAFSLPILECITAGVRKVQGIVLAPTRELARQVAEEATALAQFKDLHVVAIYGGVGFGPQEKALSEGAELVIGTPGRILDHIRRGNLDLSTVKYAALDEADEMLAQGFYEDVTKILDQTPEDRQVLMFSATIDQRVRSIIQRYTKDPLDLRLSTDADKVENIKHILYETTPDFHKVRALLAIIEQEQPKSAVIFCNTREDTATVATFLSRQGLDVELLSGELPQRKREAVMAQVKSGRTQFLTATDVAARGIDISDLTHVLNYSLPEDPAVYLHRSGRTGRIGKTGICISMVGGAELHTRKTLAGQYEIDFEVRPLPTAEEAAAARVERQVRSIKEAMGTMAFEGYLGTVRAIKERPDGDILLAAAMRAFFLWDRMRKAEEQGTADSVGALSESRSQGGGSGRGGRRRGGDRRDRRGGGGGGGGNRPQGSSEGGGDGQKRRRRRRRRGGGGGGGGGGENS